MSKIKHCLFKYVLTFHSNILCFKVLFLLTMPPGLPLIILQKQFTKSTKFSVMLCLTENFIFFFNWAVHNGMYSVQLETVLLLLYAHFPFQAVGRLQYHRNWIVTWLRQMPGWHCCIILVRGDKNVFVELGRWRHHSCHAPQDCYYRHAPLCADVNHAQAWLLSELAHWRKEISNTSGLSEPI